MKAITIAVSHLERPTETAAPTNQANRFVRRCGFFLSLFCSLIENLMQKKRLKAKQQWSTLVAVNSIFDADVIRYDAFGRFIIIFFCSFVIWCYVNWKFTYFYLGIFMIISDLLFLIGLYWGRYDMDVW